MGFASFTRRRASALLPLVTVALAACVPACEYINPDDDEGTEGRLSYVAQAPVFETRASDRGFQLRRPGRDWEDFYAIGMNFGTTIPGMNPGDFAATGEQIARWIEATADLGCNSIRTYTVQSPAFYVELRKWNLAHPDRALLLLQGAWLDEPEHVGNELPDYLSAYMHNWFRDEIERVIDVVHGNRIIAEPSAEKPFNRGRAHGTFTADVSPWLLGWLIGREVEPYTIQNSHALHPKDRHYAGAYFTLDDGMPIEAFIVQYLDYTVAYETTYYKHQHPVGFSNWPTLDPLHHATEPPFPESSEDAYDVDLVKAKVDTTKFDRGVFYSYHAYPYYPDFLLNSPDYQVSDDEGLNSYLGYLRDLRQHYKGMTLIVGETGVPSSQGTAHFAKSGLNHGALNQEQQGNGFVREIKTVTNAGLNGTFLFALIDEWFKRTWIVDRVAFPPERRPMWHNVMSPEQNFGIIALRAGAEGNFHTIDGNIDDWKSAPNTKKSDPVVVPANDGQDAARNIRALTVEHDEAYVHVKLDVENLDPDGDGKVDWDKLDYVVAFDTIDPDRGDSRIVADKTVGVERRAEFIVRIHSDSDVQFLVDRPYDTFGIWHKRREPWQMYRTVKNDDGLWNITQTLTNVEYIYKDVSFAPEQHQITGQLPVGVEEANSLTNFWYSIANNTIELRIPWNMLLFSDPSMRRVIDDFGKAQGGPEVDTTETPEIAVVAASFAGTGEDENSFADSLPRAKLKDGVYWIPAAGAARHAWDKWDTPTFHEYRKKGFDILKAQIPNVTPPSIKLPAP